MNPARFAVLGIALAAGTGAAFLMSGGDPPPPPPPPAAEAPPQPTTDVLVAAIDMPMGQVLRAADLRWQPWPDGAVANGYMTRKINPKALEETVGASVRSGFLTGEPIRAQKLVRPESGFMAAILPPGMRAVAIVTDSRGTNSAGGFILPNDRVDVIMVRKGDEDNFLTETVLSNVRVLAIDQQIEEAPDGSKSVIGTTATLELTPDQSKVMTVAQQMADRISLALRSVADAQEEDTSAADHLLSGGDGQPTIQVIKSGEVVKSNSSTANSM